MHLFLSYSFTKKEPELCNEIQDSGFVFGTALHQDEIIFPVQMSHGL